MARGRVVRHRGYPSAVGFYEERLGFANSAGQPQTLWASASGAYERFSPTDNADRARRYGNDAPSPTTR